MAAYVAAICLDGIATARGWHHLSNDIDTYVVVVLFAAIACNLALAGIQVACRGLTGALVVIQLLVAAGAASLVWWGVGIAAGTIGYFGAGGVMN